MYLVCRDNSAPSIQLLQLLQGTAQLRRMAGLFRHSIWLDRPSVLPATRQHRLVQPLSMRVRSQATPVSRPGLSWHLWLATTLLRLAQRMRRAPSHRAGDTWLHWPAVQVHREAIRQPGACLIHGP